MMLNIVLRLCIVTQDLPCLPASMAAMDVLTIDDLAPVLEETYEARAKWHNLGVALRLPEHELESIESQCSARPEDGLREMLKTWLRRVEPQPTRAALVKALASKLVGKELLAKELEEKYCRDQAPLSKSMFDQQKREGGREGERGGGQVCTPTPPHYLMFYGSYIQKSAQKIRSYKYICMIITTSGNIVTHGTEL